MMEVLLFCALTAGVIAFSPVWRSVPPPDFRDAVAGGDEKNRSDGGLSFDYLLNTLSVEYAKGLEAPVPPPDDYMQMGDDDRLWVTLSASNSRERTRLLEAGMDIVEIGKDKVSGTIPQALLPNFQTKSSRMLEMMPLSQHIALSRPKDFPDADAAFHNYQETTDLMKELAAKNPDVASLFSIGKTIEGREIWCLRLNSSAKGNEPSSKPGSFYIGTHHAREHLSTEVPLFFAVWLLDNRGTPEIKKYLDTLDIYVVPMLNADGVEYDIKTGSYRWQRKNMRVNPDKSIGVDLNRNYDSWFGGAGVSHSPSADTYCGPSAFSEPETLAVKLFIESRKNIRTSMSYHSYNKLVLYPWAGKTTPVENEKDRMIFEKLARGMAAFTGYTPKSCNELYISTGGSDDWLYSAAGIFAFSTELEGNGFYPGAGVIKNAVVTNVKAAVYLLSVTADPQAAQ
jgi:carboxypeptidase T